MFTLTCISPFYINKILYRSKQIFGIHHHVMIDFESGYTCAKHVSHMSSHKLHYFISSTLINKSEPISYT